MGFEESMIEDGFHDEEEYLVHLMDEAESLWQEEQLENNDSYDDQCNCGKGYNLEYYEELEKRYAQWEKDNPLKNELFLAWVSCYYGYPFWSMGNEGMDAFVNWEEDEAIHHNQLESYYGTNYNKIYDYLQWKSKNPVENYLLIWSHTRCSIDIQNVEKKSTRKYGGTILLLNYVDIYELWMEKARLYEDWKKNTSDIELFLFYRHIEKTFFRGDISIDYIEECLDNNGLFLKPVSSMYYQEPEELRKMVFEMECIRFFSSEYYNLEKTCGAFRYGESAILRK